MDRIVPVVIVIGRRAVPAAVGIDEGWMIPIVASILTADDSPLTGESFTPGEWAKLAFL
jgi:hypothetical protein